MEPKSVLIIDGSTLFRRGLIQLLPEKEFRIVGEARSHHEGLDLVARGERPHLVLLDCAASIVGDGIAALRRALPDAFIVHLTDTAEIGRMRSALEAGAAGYITKDRSPAALVQQLRLVMVGEKVFPPELVKVLVRGEAEPVMGSGARKGLSAREVQILRGLVQGHSNKKIALDLSITEATVKVHLKSLLRKINVNNRTQAAIWAMNQGFAAPEMAA